MTSTIKNAFYHLNLVLLLIFSVGCGKNCAVSGRVTFPDGTPLTVGKVAFETATYQATGPIDSDGYFKMGGSKPGDGVPKGTYSVAIQDVMKPTMVPPPEGTPRGTPPKLIMPKAPPIDLKYLTPAKSGLTCEVKGRTTYNITVEPPQ